MRRPWRRRDPADGLLLSPIGLAALVLLLVNDHVLKAAFPGWVTGKLSDVAGLALAPIMIAAAWDVLSRRAGRDRGSTRPIAIATVAVAAAFVLVKLEVHANEAYAVAMGGVAWVLAIVPTLVGGGVLAPPVHAPTVMDPSDLLALPAVLAGWWAAGGSPAPAPRVPRFAARTVVLACAVFAIAATSPPSYAFLTGVGADEVTLEPGGTVERHAVVTIPAAGDGSSITIEARSRWPLVEPAPRYVLAAAPPATAGPSDSSLALAPGTCTDGCEVPVTVTITWPGPVGHPSTSIAWEVAATVWADPGNGMYLGYSSPPSVRGVDFEPRSSLGWLFAIPIVILIALLYFATGGRPAPRAGTGVRTPRDAVTVGAATAFVVALLAFPNLLPPDVLEPGAGLTASTAAAISVALALTAAAGVVRWWFGTGALLAIAILTTVLVGLPIAGRLVESASRTFALTGMLAVMAAFAVAMVAFVGALSRPGRTVDYPPSHEFNAPSRIIVASIGTAVCIGLILPARFDSVGASFAGLVLVLHAIALIVWWYGSAKLLGLSSFLIGGGALLRLFIGPTLFGPGWSSWGVLTIVLVMIGAAATLFAAFNVYAPSRKARPVDDPAAAAAVVDPPVG